jgi:hypothetical protein
MSKRLGKAEQALYERLRFGALTAGEATFFSRQIGALIAERIARRTTEGGVELVNPASYVTQPPPATTSSAPPASAQSGEHSVSIMPTVTARVPQEVIDYADAIRDAVTNESRGSALRRLLSAAVERGLCKPAPMRKTNGVHS